MLLQTSNCTNFHCYYTLIFNFRILIYSWCLYYLGTSVRQLAQRYFGVSPDEGTQKSDSESSTDSLFQMQHPQYLKHQQLHSAVSQVWKFMPAIRVVTFSNPGTVWTALESEVAQCCHFIDCYNDSSCWFGFKQQPSAVFTKLNSALLWTYVDLI